jgi:hypothetical protein
MHALENTFPAKAFFLNKTDSEKQERAGCCRDNSLKLVFGKCSVRIPADAPALFTGRFS